MLPALVLLLAAADPAPPGAGPALAPEAIEAQTAPDGIPGVVASFTVAAPAAFVLDQLWDGRNSPRIFSQIHRRTVVERPDANSIVLEYELKSMIGNMTYRQRNVVEKNPDGSGIMRWLRLSGDLDVVRGHWRVTPLGPSLCRVEYANFVATGPKVFYGFVGDQALAQTRGLAQRVRAVITATQATPIAP
jgi:hypothetical protein